MKFIIWIKTCLFDLSIILQFFGELGKYHFSLFDAGTFKMARVKTTIFSLFNRSNSQIKYVWTALIKENLMNQ